MVITKLKAPAFKYHGQFICYSAYKEHFSLSFPISDKST
jgi:hypothetical protein